MPDNFEIKGVPPVEPGVSPAYKSEKDGIIPGARPKFSSKTKLAEIQKDYAFFHPGLLYEEVPLDHKRDPFADFCAHKNNSNLRPSIFMLGERFIEGWPASSDAWAHTIYVLEKPILEEYLCFVGSAAFVDRSNQEVFFLSPQRITIKDPSCSDSYWNDKSIDVTFFGLETNKRTWYFLGGMSGKTRFPRRVRLLKTMRPDIIKQDVLNAANAILSNDIRI